MFVVELSFNYCIINTNKNKFSLEIDAGIAFVSNHILYILCKCPLSNLNLTHLLQQYSDILMRNVLLGFTAIYFYYLYFILII